MAGVAHCHAEGRGTETKPLDARWSSFQPLHTLNAPKLLLAFGAAELLTLVSQAERAIEIAP
jgi:hypothetical protein